jgi:hypothetical protein
MVASLIHFCYIMDEYHADISVHFFIISPLSFRVENNPDPVKHRKEAQN